MVVCLAVVAGCSSGPSEAASAEVRHAVIDWFTAAQTGDPAAVKMMSSSCTSQQLTSLLLFPTLANGASLSKVQVESIDGDSATVKIELPGKTGGTMHLSREEGVWKVRCDS
jgi:hypothetical protein